MKRGVLGGWQVSGIVTGFSSSIPRTVTQSSGIAQSRPDRVASVDMILPDWQDTCDATGCSYLNPAAWVAVPTNRLTNATTRPGTAGAGEVLGPSQWELNTTIAKNFRMGGETSLQVRVDMFSALNTKIWGDPVTAFGNTQFGRITSARGNRTMQIGARLAF
jgi:hypothetical protein